MLDPTSLLADLPEVLTPAEMARALRVKRTTGYRLLREHQIPSFKVGRLRRVRRDDLIAFMRQQGRAA